MERLYDCWNEIDEIVNQKCGNGCEWDYEWNWDWDLMCDSNWNCDCDCEFGSVIEIVIMSGIVVE